MTYAIADLKLYDKGQLKKMNFSSFDQMNNYIIETWNSVITDDDIVYVMGKIGKGTVSEMKKVISNLKGSTFLISKKSNPKYTKEQLKEIGFSMASQVNMYTTLDGKEIIYLSQKVDNIQFYLKKYDLLIVDSSNPIEGIVQDKQLSASAMLWSYSPLKEEDLLTIYNNMQEFMSFEDGEEHRSEIKEEGEE